MALLALSGSSARASLNHRLIVWAAAQTELQVDVVRILDHQAPMFSVDVEAEIGIPETIQALFDQLAASDGLILATPEHNGGPPAMLKNTVDWLSRIDRKVFARKTLLLSTSPGPRGGITNLTHWANLIPHWGATVVGAHSLPRFNDAFDENGPVDPTFADAVRTSLKEFEKN